MCHYFVCKINDFVEQNLKTMSQSCSSSDDEECATQILDNSVGSDVYILPTTLDDVPLRDSSEDQSSNNDISLFYKEKSDDGDASSQTHSQDDYKLVDNGLVDNGLVDNGLVDNGLVDNGLVDNGLVDNDDGQNFAKRFMTTNNGEASSDVDQLCDGDGSGRENAQIFADYFCNKAKQPRAQPQNDEASKTIGTKTVEKKHALTDSATNGNNSSDSSNESSSSNSSSGSSTIFNSNQTLDIFTMTWNTQSVMIAERLQKTGQEPVSVISKSVLGCKNPDFLPVLVKKYIFKSQTASSPHLIVVALQESAKPGDYLLSDALPNELGDRYQLIKRGRLIGVGRTTVTTLRDEATLIGRGLRLAIYARSDFVRHVHFQAEKTVLATTKDILTRGKGGYGIVLRIDGFGLCAFLNVHLPFSAQTIKQGNHERLKTGVQEQNQAFSHILREFLKGRSLHHFFVLGDLNYRVLHFENSPDAAGLCTEMYRQPDFRQQIYEKYDELRQSMLCNMLPLKFLEGIDNGGPQFMPTAKMAHSRQPMCTKPAAYEFGKTNMRNASWCDRILYLPGSLQSRKTIAQMLECQDNDEGQTLCRPAQCVLYERFESGQTMVQSDHTAVCAKFLLTRRQ